jgi:hypothetical protein
MEVRIVLSLVSLLASIIGMMSANRCRHNPERCARRFISNFGAPQSIFAIKYAGEVEAARRAIREDVNLRKKYVVEQFISSFAIGIAGILLLFLPL